MKTKERYTRTRAQESTAAIERMYITMRHLFNRGFYKPSGISGETLQQALLQLRPEIYGTIAEDKLEIQGLHYVIERLPYGIESCTYINLTSDEGFLESHFPVIIPPKRRRNCYRIDEEQMQIEITRGRSDIYDILTHLTFLFTESNKIKEKIWVERSEKTIRDWDLFEAILQKKKTLHANDVERALTHVATFSGRTFQELKEAYSLFTKKENPNRFLEIIYHLGQTALKEHKTKEKRTITFSTVLRERIGHHLHGERWANQIKQTLLEKELLDRPLHIVSANMHSVLNTLFAQEALKESSITQKNLMLYKFLSKPENRQWQQQIYKYAQARGMHFIKDKSGANIDVQIFDTQFLPEYKDTKQKPVLIVMDYAFGEQAYETLDELLKPFNKTQSPSVSLQVQSVSVMGKAGILTGEKGDIMIPQAHVFEGTADNYPFKNQLKESDFKNCGVPVKAGSMITVLGTSLQNKDLLEFFKQSTWNVIGLEMEGAHYQKAIQAASKIRKSIPSKVKVRYAYYASDNPLETGSTLASGGLGESGVKPTYIITEKMLNQVLEDSKN